MLSGAFLHRPFHTEPLLLPQERYNQHWPKRRFIVIMWSWTWCLLYAHKLAFGARLFDFRSYAFSLLMMWPVGFLENIFHTKKASQATLQLDWIRSSQKLEVIVEVKPTAEKNATDMLEIKTSVRGPSVFKRTRTFSKFWLIFRKESTECRN